LQEGHVEVMKTYTDIPRKIMVFPKLDFAFVCNLKQKLGTFQLDAKMSRKASKASGFA
jgi:hypothetical protein